MNTYWAPSSVLSTLLIVASGAAQANGTETLGPPNIVIAPGTNLFIEGTGAITQPGTINVSIPAGATIKQVLLYWQGYMIANVAGDNHRLGIQRRRRNQHAGHRHADRRADVFFQ